MVGGKGGVI